MQLELMKEYKIENVIKEAYEACSKELKNENLNVIVLPTSGNSYGFTPSSNLFVLYVSCLEPKEKVIDTVKWIFAHEYAHSCDTRYSRERKDEVPLYSNTVLRDMVFEGKANNFADFMYGDRGFKLDKEYCSNDWGFYKTRLNDCSYSVADGQVSKIGNETFSRYDVYVYGTEIVKTYIAAHPDLTVLDWLILPPSAYEDQAGEVIL